MLSSLYCTAAGKEEGTIRTLFNTYKKSVLADKGIDAVRLLDSRTLRYYDTMAQLTKYADSTQLATRGFTDRIIVLASRMMVSPARIAAMDGKAFLIWAIGTGLVGKNGIVSTTLGAITVSQNFAKAVIIKDGQPSSDVYLHFYKEAGAWKFNLTDILPVAEAGMKQLLTQNNETEESFLLKVLPAMAHRTCDKLPWSPIAQ